LTLARCYLSLSFSEARQLQREINYLIRARQDADAVVAGELVAAHNELVKAINNATCQHCRMAEAVAARKLCAYCRDYQKSSGKLPSVEVLAKLAEKRLQKKSP